MFLDFLALEASDNIVSVAHVRTPKNMFCFTLLHGSLVSTAHICNITFKV